MVVEQNTERINRHQLVRLLDTMTSIERQAITQRTFISDVEGALAPKECTTSGPRYRRPFSHVAAMLPPVKPVRSPRPTLTGPSARTLPNPVPVAVAAPSHALDDETAVELSLQVVAQLSQEEIAMLPAWLRPVALVREPKPAPRIEPETVAPQQPGRRWIALVLAALFAVALVMLLAVHALA